MKKVGLLCILLALSCGVAYAFDRDPRCGDFRGEIFKNGQRIFCSNPKYRIASFDTFGMDLSFDEVKQIAEWWQKPSLRLTVTGMLQRRAKEGKVYNIPIDTKVTLVVNKEDGILEDWKLCFKAKVLGTDKELWFLSEYFFLDDSRENE